MPNYLRYSAIFLIITLTLSCNLKPEAKKDPAQSAGGPTLEYDTLTDDMAAFISGMENSKTGCLSKLESTRKWTGYCTQLDSIFYRISESRYEKMKSWADSELIDRHGHTTIFYPFSGPDFLNANLFYPDADQYILMGLEPIGFIPDLCSMHPDSVGSYLNSINNSLIDMFKRSYFITATMIKDLKNTKVNGTIPLITLFIKRTGHHIISIRKAGINAEGNLVFSDSLLKKKNIVPGIQINFLSTSGKKEQSVLYFRTDISDKGLEKNPGFKTYLSNLPQSYTYLKAASYLLHYETFNTIRSLIFSVSSTILQDDSGIAYKYFDKTKWNIKLYGKYSKPTKEFSFISEPDLEKAYQTYMIRPLPYTIGYNWRTGNSNLLYAIKIKK
jgi:hypothetical protein